MMKKKSQGVDLPRYSLIPRTLIFIRQGDQVLMLKGASTKRLWAGRYNGIGGHVERGEDVLSSARRELLEETGLWASLWICGVVLVDASDTTGVGIYVILGDYQGGELKESTEGELAWIGASELHFIPLVEDLEVLLPRVMNMQPGDAPFSALYTFEGDEEKLRISFG